MVVQYLLIINPVPQTQQVRSSLSTPERRRAFALHFAEQKRLRSGFPARPKNKVPHSSQVRSSREWRASDILR